MIGRLFKKTNGNLIQFFKESEEYYQQYLDLIQSAQKSIHLQTYIFHDDKFGRAVINALKSASRRQVKIYLLIDSLGSFSLSEYVERELIEAGINFCWFNFVHLKRLGQVGRRLHHKVLLVDDQKAIIGGINVISDSFQTDGKPHQLDFAVLIEGPVIEDLTTYCRHIFNKSSKTKIKFENSFVTSVAYSNGVDLKISINDWIYQRWQITRQYSELTNSAEKEITILNSYFFPRRKFMKQLSRASKRGVRIRLILPELSDWPWYVLASQYLYSYFLKNGVEIYQWKQSVLHGKLATIDGKWSTIGSFNLNYTGYQQNLEMNVAVYSAEFTENLNFEIEKMLKDGCEKIEMAQFIEKASLKTRALRFICYIGLQIIANLSVGIALQEEKNRNRFIKAIFVITALVLMLLGIIGSVVPSIPGTFFLILAITLLMFQVLLNNKDV